MIRVVAICSLLFCLFAGTYFHGVSIGEARCAAEIQRAADQAAKAVEPMVAEAEQTRATVAELAAALEPLPSLPTPEETASATPADDDHLHATAVRVRENRTLAARDVCALYRARVPDAACAADGPAEDGAHAARDGGGEPSGDAEPPHPDR